MTNSIPNEVEMTWSFSPKNLFEERIFLIKTGYEIEIEDGKIKVNIEPVLFSKNREIIEFIEKEVVSIFFGAQVFGHKKGNISKYKLISQYPDGSSGHVSHVDTLVSVATITENLDLIQKDKDGNIIFDSKVERINNRKNFFELLATYYHSDITVKAITDSYIASINDPNDELVHLYEIRDSFVTRFVSLNNVRKKLEIGHKEWRSFGKLANNVPLKQSRHRGTNPGQLRSATHVELEEARKFVKKLIFNYLKLLDS